jgi:hypothetical protein
MKSAHKFLDCSKNFNAKGDGNGHDEKWWAM